MSIRTKLVAALALISALASVGIGVLSYRATEDRLRDEVDRSLDDTVAAFTRGGDREPSGPSRGRPPFPSLGPGPGQSADVLRRSELVRDLVSVQILDDSGAVVARSGSIELPVDDPEREVAARTDPPNGGGDAGRGRDGDAVRRFVTIGDVRYRQLTVGRSGGGAVQVARSLAENDRLLESLRNQVIVLVFAVSIAAAAVGWLIAWQLTRRLTRLTGAAEQVAGTGRLDVDVPSSGGDEAGRLAAAFKSMLSALAQSRSDQQRLVQDAGHELRTPLTSLRTNVSVLRRHADLGPDELSRLLDDLDGETRELTDLVNELVELATGSRDDEPEEAVALAPLAERVAERARRRSGREVVVSADAAVVVGRAAALERALSNLVDNAAKFDDGGVEPIEISVSTGSGTVAVRVSDRGPGVGAEDLPHLFDRFYRATDARSRPGSGLGLAIVKAVADQHGGTVVAENRPGGGAVIGFDVPIGGPISDRAAAVG